MWYYILDGAAIETDIVKHVISLSLRNILLDALQLVHHLCEQTGLSIADLLRQAIVSGLLVEATKATPGQDGTLGGLEAEYLAKALRRHLSSAIDLLLEHGSILTKA